MATLSFEELVINDHLTNPSNYNPTTMTNSSLTSLSSGKVSGHKRKRSSMSNILSSKAGQAKKFLKKFSMPFVQSNNSVKFSPNKIVPNNGLSALGEHGKKIIGPSPSHENTSSVDNIGLKKIEMYQAMGNTNFLARSPKAVCFDSESSTKWSRLEISITPEKCDKTSSVGSFPWQRDFVSSSHMRASRMLCWDEVSTDGSLKKVLPRWSNDVDCDEMVRGCMPLNNDGVTNDTPTANNQENDHVHILRHHLQTGSSLDIKSYEPSSVEYKNLVTNSTNPLFIKNVYTETSWLKAMLDDSSLFSDNIDATSKTMVQHILETSWEKDNKELLVESDDNKATESSMLNRGLNSIRMKSTRSLLFVPFPNVPFKIKAIQPIHARFEVYYTESSMIPIVKTEGKVFEAQLQEITIDSAGQEGFRRSPSGFCCTISVEKSDSVAKFEEIKKALRVVCNTYNFDAHTFKRRTLPKVMGNGIKDRNGETDITARYPIHRSDTADSGAACAADFSEVSTEQYNLQASSVDHDKVASGIAGTGSVNTEQIVASYNQVSLTEESVSDEKEDGVSANNRRQAVGIVRRSRRKFKTAGLWKERNAYATRVTRPTLLYPVQDENNLVCPVKFIDDHKYLDRTMLVNQFIQDITGVPVVVLERLSSEALQGKLNNASSST